MIIIPADKTNIMLDLETVSTAPNAAMIAVGAVYFDEQEIIDDFYQVLQLSTCFRRGMHADGDTIAWWMKQSDAARAVFQETKTVSLTQMLINFQTWCRSCKNTGVDYNIAMWGNGVDFDNVILSSAYRRCQYNQPWDFRDNYCYRTVKKCFPKVPKPECALDKIKHHALDDATIQAEHLININRTAHKLFAI